MSDIQKNIFELIEVEVTTNDLELLMANPDQYVKSEWDAIKLKALFEFINMTNEIKAED